MSKKFSINDSFVALNSHKLFVRKWELQSSSKKTPIILVHDSLGSVEMWRDFPERVSGILQSPVLAYDRWGHGHSDVRMDTPKFDYVAREGQELAELVRSLGYHAVHLLGHSIGGAMALVAAEKLGSVCKSVVSISAQSFVESQTVSRVHDVWKKFLEPATLNKLRPYHHERAEWAINAWGKIWTDPSFGTWRLRPLISHVQCPVLIIHGDSDEYGTTAFADEIAKSIHGPHVVDILKGVGHFPHREQPDKVLATIEHFGQTFKLYN